MIIWVLIIMVVFILSSIFWIKTAVGHRFISILFIGVFALLDLFVDASGLPAIVGCIFMLIICLSASNGPGFLSGLLLGVETTAAIMTGLLILPIFPQELYYNFMTWLLNGGRAILMVLFWPIALAIIIFIKVTDY